MGALQQTYQRFAGLAEPSWGHARLKQTIQHSRNIKCSFDQLLHLFSVRLWSETHESVAEEFGFAVSRVCGYF
jgi:hypothetical protein